MPPHPGVHQVEHHACSMASPRDSIGVPRAAGFGHVHALHRSPPRRGPQARNLGPPGLVRLRRDGMGVVFPIPTCETPGVPRVRRRAEEVSEPDVTREVVSPRALCAHSPEDVRSGEELRGRDHPGAEPADVVLCPSSGSIAPSQRRSAQPPLRHSLVSAFTLHLACLLLDAAHRKSPPPTVQPRVQARQGPASSAWREADPCFSVVPQTAGSALHGRSTGLVDPEEGRATRSVPAARLAHHDPFTLHRPRSFASLDRRLGSPEPQVGHSVHPGSETLHSSEWTPVPFHATSAT